MCPCQVSLSFSGAFCWNESCPSIHVSETLKASQIRESEDLQVVDALNLPGQPAFANKHSTCKLIYIKFLESKVRNNKSNLNRGLKPQSCHNGKTFEQKLLGKSLLQHETVLTAAHLRKNTEPGRTDEVAVHTPLVWQSCSSVSCCARRNLISRPRTSWQLQALIASHDLLGWDLCVSKIDRNMNFAAI